MGPPEEHRPWELGFDWIGLPSDDDEGKRRRRPRGIDDDWLGGFTRVDGGRDMIEGKM